MNDKNKVKKLNNDHLSCHRRRDFEGCSSSFLNSSIISSSILQILLSWWSILPFSSSPSQIRFPPSLWSSNPPKIFDNFTYLRSLFFLLFSLLTSSPANSQFHPSLHLRSFSQNFRSPSLLFFVRCWPYKQNPSALFLPLSLRSLSLSSHYCSCFPTLHGFMTG